MADQEFLARIRVEPLDHKHDRAVFACGASNLDNYIRITASRQQKENMTRIRVGCLDDSNSVICFHAMNAHCIDISELDDSFKKRFPRYDAIPSIYLSMLGVHAEHQGRGVGSHMMRDAMMQAMRASDSIGAHFLVLDALNEDAARLYARLGFQKLSGNPERMLISFETIRRAGAAAARS